MASNSGPGMTDADFARGRAVFANIVAKYYGDPDFKARVDANPTEMLRAEGVHIPPGVSMKLLFDSDKVMHIVLPSKAALASIPGRR